MTREAKIGLLTGLGVIVLIGVLLSEYLGPAAGAGASNRMAALPLGAGYRQQVMEPAVAPGTLRSEVAGDSAGSYSGAPASNLPQAFAVSDGSDPTALATGPVVGSPVTAVPDGRISSEPLAVPEGPPTLRLVETHGAVVAAAPGAAAAKAVVAGEHYVIVSGDTLSKIAKKYYKSSKPEEQERIVAANPGVLKNVGTMLVVGKTLVIPGAARAVAVVGSVPAMPRVGGGAAVVIHPPGNTTLPPASAGVKTSADSRVYTVQGGDTLEKIARKLSPTNPLDFAKQLATLNKIKDPHGLQINQKLRLPGKS